MCSSSRSSTAFGAFFARVPQNSVIVFSCISKCARYTRRSKLPSCLLVAAVTRVEERVFLHGECCLSPGASSSTATTLDVPRVYSLESGRGSTVPARCALMISVVIIAFVEWTGGGNFIEVDRTFASFLEDEENDNENVSGQALKVGDDITESLR